MRKDEYLKELSYQLSSLDYKARQDIIYDFEEHFAIGLAAGKSEEQICAELGSPTESAQQYLNFEKGTSYASPDYNRQASYAQGYAQSAAARHVINRFFEGDRLIYTILLTASVFAGIFFSFPVALCFLCACPALIIAAVFSGVLVSSFSLACFLISLGIAFLCAGMLLILLNVWAIKLCADKLRLRRASV